ncbi:MAG: allophanate hydrolase subunit 1 [Pseudorhodobacter sp.]|nr:MAG: allophanate hydrolase subunit 1 [Pseudorhodobacter sp.]
MTPLFRPVAEHALLVEFGTRLSDDTHAAVLRLDRALAASPFPGFAESVPAYVNLSVRFDPLTTDHAAVETALRGLLDHAPTTAAAGTLHPVDITYDGQDLPEVAARTGLTVAEVIAAHQAATYHVALYGFAPGYAYLSGLAAAIHLPRKDTALRDVPAGSVIIAAGQCIVTTLTMPTGWWIIGHSPTPILRPADPRPFLLDVGDRVQFRQVPR